MADRFSRRRLVVIANLVGALGVSSLAFVRDAGDVWIVYVVTFGYGLLTYLTSACASGLIKDLVPDEGLAAANGLLATIDQGLRLLSPLAGAGLYASFGGTAVGALTAVTLVIAALVVSTIRMVETPPTPVDERGAFGVEFTAGFRHLRITHGLGWLTVLLAIAFGFAGMANTAIFALVEEGLGRSPAFFAVIAAMQGLGSVGGGITAAMLIGRLGERMTLSIGLLVLGAGVTTMLTTSTTVVGMGDSGRAAGPGVSRLESRAQRTADVRDCARRGPDRRCRLPNHRRRDECRDDHLRRTRPTRCRSTGRRRRHCTTVLDHTPKRRDRAGCLTSSVKRPQA